MSYHAAARAYLCEPEPEETCPVCGELVCLLSYNCHVAPDDQAYHLGCFEMYASELAALAAEQEARA